MVTATTVPETELPTIWHPKAIRQGLTASITTHDGRALQVILNGLDDGDRVCRLSLPAATIVALAALCASTMPESERYG